MYKNIFDKPKFLTNTDFLKPYKNTCHHIIQPQFNTHITYYNYLYDNGYIDENGLKYVMNILNNISYNFNKLEDFNKKIDYKSDKVVME